MNTGFWTYALVLGASALSVQGQPATTNAPAAELIDDMKKARALKAERDELARVYGTFEDTEVQDLTSKFNQIIRKIAPTFPLLDPNQRPATNRFFRLVLNGHGGGLDGFRFRNSSSEPKNFGWIFGFERPVSMDSWFIIPAAEDQKMRGFTRIFDPKLEYENAPWSETQGVGFEKIQWLADSSILPGQEYIIWFSFRNDRPHVLHLAFDLFPSTERFSSRSLIDEHFGLKGRPR